MKPYVEKLLRSPLTTPVSVDVERRTVEVCFLSGEPLERNDWDGTRYELVLEPEGADLGRFESGAGAVLDTHRQSPITSQVGVIERAWRVGKGFFARIRFSERPEVEGLWRDVAAGIVRGISLGAEILAYRDDHGTDGKLMRRVVTSWRPFELSVVAVPADAGAVTLEHEPPKGKTKMEKAVNPSALAGDETVQGILNKMGVDRAALLARIETGELADVPAIRGAAFELLAHRTEATPTRVGAVSTIGRDAGDTLRNGMSEALCARAQGRAPKAEGEAFRGISMANVARELLQARGESPSRFASDFEVVKLAMHTSSDFANLLGNVAGKVVMDAYRAAESGLKRVARRSTANDFKTLYRMRRGEFPTLIEQVDGADYVSGSIGEQSESYRVRTYARLFTLSRQAIINDDAQAFSDAAQMVGVASANFEGALIAATLYGAAGVGPAMSDGSALFHANHGNVAGAGGAISDATLSAGRLAMRLQKGIDGTTVVGAAPKFLVVPATKETLASQHLAVIAPAAASNVNVFSGQLELAVDPHLDGKSTTGWYLFADPTVLPVLELAYLNGVEGPAVEQQVNFNNDALTIKCRLDVGVGIVDWRGAYRNAGA
jgi:phage major head subunit gpT-like protein